MCGRFNVSSDPLTEIFLELTGQPFPGEENFNTAPTEDAWIVRLYNDEYQAMGARWWLIPYWSREPAPKYAMFNAKCETLEKSGAFKEPFRHRRCLVPVSGFYEWLASKEGKLPYYIKPTDDSAMLLAGLWDRWKSRETGEVIRSFTIVTTTVHPKLEFIHNRQPVILSRDDARVWMDHHVPLDDLKPLFQPVVREALSIVPVSTYVSNSRNKEARCIDPIGRTIDIEPD